MSGTPFMPLWVSDFLGDTLDLDAKEIGAYMLLLMALWQRGGTLPEDISKLKRVARCGRDWPRIWGAIERFFVIENGTISNKRLMRELQKVDAKRAVNAQNGARGGRAKALKNNNAGLANAKRTLKQPEPYPERDTNVSLAREDLFDEFWSVYPHRNGAKKGRAKAKASFGKAVKAGTSQQEIIAGAKRYRGDRQVLDGYAKDPTTWLNQSGWQDDIEPPKQNHQQQRGGKPKTIMHGDGGYELPFAVVK